MTKEPLSTAVLRFKGLPGILWLRALSRRRHCSNDDAGTTHSRSPLYAWAAPNYPNTWIALSRLLFLSVLLLVLRRRGWLLACESSMTRAWLDLHAESQRSQVVTLVGLGLRPCEPPNQRGNMTRRTANKGDGWGGVSRASLETAGGKP